MDGDRGFFAGDVSGDGHDVEPVGAPLASVRKGAAAPDIDIGADPDGAFDEAVFAILSSAKQDGPIEDASAADELCDAELSGPVPPGIASVPEKTGKKLLSTTVLVSLVLHTALFAAALHMVTAIPDEPLEAGSVNVSVVMLGNGDVDALAAGDEEVVPEPLEVEAVPVETETATAVAAETLPPVEQVMPQEVAEPVETVAVEPEAVPALPSPEPEVLSVAPTEMAAPDTVAPAAAAPVEATEPVESEALAAAVTTAEPPAEVEPLQATTPETEAIKPQEDNPELAYDIAAPVPEPNPWREEQVPDDQVAAHKAATQKPEPVRRTPAQTQRTAGSGGQSNHNAARGAANGVSREGASQAAQGSANASDNGAAAMANYAGKVGSRLRRAVSPSRYYRGVGKLKTTVVVKVTLNRSGAISGLSLAQSSGNGTIDSVVLERARSAGPFGSFPASYTKSSHSFRLPINLNLN